MRRIPVHVVTGVPAAGKSALVARLARARPDWLGLVNSLPADSVANLKPLSASCPCCVGRVVLQVSLVRALRETGATRAFVELADAQHAANLARLLGELPFSLSVEAGRTIILPRDAGISASEFDA